MGTRQRFLTLMHKLIVLIPQGCTKVSPSAQLENYSFLCPKIKNKTAKSEILLFRNVLFIYHVSRTCLVLCNLVTVWATKFLPEWFVKYSSLLMVKMYLTGTLYQPWALCLINIMLISYVISLRLSLLCHIVI